MNKYKYSVKVSSLYDYSSLKYINKNPIDYTEHSYSVD